MELNNSAGTIKIFLAVIITALLTFFLTREFSGGYEKIGSASDTTSSTTVKYIPQRSSFSAVQIGNIKRRLIDSLSGIYKAKAKQVFAGPQLPAVKPDSADQKAEVKPEEELQYAYTSEIDSIIVAKDSTGKTTDSTHAKSTIISDTPLSKKLIHLLEIDHTSYNKETAIETKITDTIIVEKKKSFFDLFKIKIGVVGGYDIINKQFGITAGAGFVFEL